MLFRYLTISILFIIIFSVNAKQIGFVMETNGPVAVYRKPGVKVLKKKRVSIVKFEGEKLQHFKALKYEKLYSDDVLVTGKGARVKIVLKNKNVLFVNEYGKLKLPSDLDTSKDKNLFSLMYGKVRGVVIKKKGERMNVPTPAAVMGIRGTDFLMGYAPHTGETEISVIRGEVTLEKKAQPEKAKKREMVESVKAQPTSSAPDPIVIKSGYTAAIKVKSEKKYDKPIDGVKKAIKEETAFEITKPKEISLQKIDEAKMISMVEDPKKKDKISKEEVLEEAKEEAVKADKMAEKEIINDIVRNDKSLKPSEIKSKKIDLNKSLEKVMDKTLEKEGLDISSYKKVPVEARVKAREAGMADKELTPRHIRDKSKLDPKVKSVFDSFVELF
jgi:hypothetical protein